MTSTVFVGIVVLAFDLLAIAAFAVAWRREVGRDRRRKHDEQIALVRSYSRRWHFVWAPDSEWI